MFLLRAIRRGSGAQSTEVTLESLVSQVSSVTVADEQAITLVNNLLQLVRDRDDVLQEMPLHFGKLVQGLSLQKTGEFELDLQNAVLDTILESLCLPQNDKSPDQRTKEGEEEEHSEHSSISQVQLGRMKSESLDPEISAIYHNNMEIFLQEGHLNGLIALLDSNHRQITYQIIQIISLFLKEGMLEKMQMSMLSESLAINRICELLRDEREIIRNESLLLIRTLCKNNPAIQKIMVFENAFENLFKIIEEEKLSYGAVLLQDSLRVVEVLLSKNDSNKNHFRETGFVPKLTVVIQLISDPQESKSLEPEKKTKICRTTLEIIRHLLDIPNKRDKASSLKSFAKQQPQLAQALIELARDGNLQIDCLHTITLLLEDCLPAKEALSLSESFASTLLRWVTDNKDPLVLSMSLLCLGTFLEDNRSAQEKLIHQCTGLFRSILNIRENEDTLRSWSIMKVIQYDIRNNPSLKQSYLDSGMFQQLLNIIQTRLQKEDRLDRRIEIGMLLLLEEWLNSHLESVSVFVDSKLFANLPKTVEQLPITDILVRGMLMMVISAALDTVIKAKEFNADKKKNLLQKFRILICDQISIEKLKVQLVKLKESSEMQKSKTFTNISDPMDTFSSLRGLNLFEPRNEECLTSLMESFDQTLLQLFMSADPADSRYSSSPKALHNPDSEAKSCSISPHRSPNRGFFTRFTGGDSKDLGDRVSEWEDQRALLEKDNKSLREHIQELERLLLEKDMSSTLPVDNQILQTEQIELWQQKYYVLEAQYHDLQKKHESLLLLLGHLRFKDLNPERTDDERLLE